MAPEEGASTRQMVQKRLSCSAGSRKHACRNCVQSELEGALLKARLMSSAGASHASCVSSGMSMLTYLRGDERGGRMRTITEGAWAWEEAHEKAREHG